MTLEEFFAEHDRVAVAFSGGVDSAFLLSAALRYGACTKAYYVKTAFQPQFELEDARKLAEQLGAELEILEVDILCHGSVVSNPADRCYHCKKVIMEAIRQKAAQDGYEILLDGTNASDQAGDRPGMRALAEKSVLSPLRQCGLTKEEIRRLSREAGLFTWEKPAYACLATRIPTGEAITKEKLHRTEEAESLLSALGFVDFRVRSKEDAAKVQLTQRDLPRLLEHRAEILEKLKQYYKEVTLDLEVRS